MKNQALDSIILFDLGNTLVYRDKSHEDFDVELIGDLLQKKSSDIKPVLDKWSVKFPGIYSFQFDNQYCRTLGKERKYNETFFQKVFTELKNPKMLPVFLEKRSAQIRYNLYPETLKYLQCLTKTYILGIATNGRPSRRLVMKQLGIADYFNPEMIFISDEIGKAKPERSFYLYVMKKLPDMKKMILGDDEVINLLIAKQCGWETLKIDHKKNGFAVFKDIIDL